MHFNLDFHVKCLHMLQIPHKFAEATTLVLLKIQTQVCFSPKRNSIIHVSIRYSFLDFTRPLPTTYLKPHYTFMRISTVHIYSQMCTKMWSESQNNAQHTQKLINRSYFPNSINSRAIYNSESNIHKINNQHE